MYKYKSLKNVSMEVITKCANSAFSDYIIPMQFTKETLEKYLISTKINFDLCCGAFYEDELVGIMGVAVEEYKGEKFAFDIITGIVPEHRGKGVFSKMFNNCKEGLIKAGIHKYMLEVIVDNKKAVAVYGKQGFKITRNYSLFNGPVNEKSYGENIKQVELSNFNSNILPNLYTYEPSFQDRTEALKVYENDYSILYKMDKEKIAAFCIYRKDSGYIAQMGAGENGVYVKELKDILIYLGSKYENIRTGNVDGKHKEIIEMLKKLGLKNFANQYEMALEF